MNHDLLGQLGLLKYEQVAVNNTIERRHWPRNQGMCDDIANLPRLQFIGTNAPKVLSRRRSCIATSQRAKIKTKRTAVVTTARLTLVRRRQSTPVAACLSPAFRHTEAPVFEDRDQSLSEHSDFSRSYGAATRRRFRRPSRRARIHKGRMDCQAQRFSI
ncbi:uncharacterized protein BDV17DRAFT_41516 [Aspergillus undulatus]|uniref:uncharacterized protein n=1 Tax=Aspergillus undulatus TaxID=1810928 RepID=UPI003CCDCEF7